MVRLLTALFALLLPAAVASATPDALSDVARHTTPDGHAFWHVPMADAKRTAIAMRWRSGLPSGEGRHEATARLGIALMQSGGAGGLPSDELAAELEDLDSASRLWVRPGEINGFLLVPGQHLTRAAEIANLVLARPDLSDRWLEREKRDLIRNTQLRGETAVGRAWALARAIMLEDHPFSRFWSAAPTEDVGAVDATAVADWHRNAFATVDMTITAAGPDAPEAVARAIDSALAGLPDAAESGPLAFDGPDVKPGTIVLHDPESPKSVIMAFGALPPAAAQDDVVLGTATAVLGLGKQSRLFTAIRSQLRAAYRFGAGIEALTREHRMLRMGGEVETALLPQALETMRDTYETFRRDGVGEAEFAAARDARRQRIEDRLEKPGGAASLLMRNRLSGQPVEDFERLAARLDDIDNDAVNATISTTYPRYEDLLTLIVTPDADAVEGACVITAIAEWRNCF